MAYLTWNLRHDATNSPPGKRGLHRAPGPQRTHAAAKAKVAVCRSAAPNNPRIPRNLQDSKKTPGGLLVWSVLYFR